MRTTCTLSASLSSPVRMRAASPQGHGTDGVSASFFTIARGMFVSYMWHAADFRLRVLQWQLFGPM